MLLNQLSIFVENRPGRLAEITKMLGDAEVDIRALSIADTTDYGILRLIVDRPERAMEVLKKENMTVSLTNVIAVAIDDKPGALSSAIQVLSKEGITVEYMYAFLNPTADTACVILRVEDNQRAIQVLTDHHVALMKSEEVYKL